MKINKIQQNDQNNTFKAKVSQKFINSMRGFINNNENRLKNNYKLTQKIEEFNQMGYGNYTIVMQQKSTSLGFEYRLLAIKDGESLDNAICLTKKPYASYRKIFDRFMNYTRYDFNNIMRKYAK